MTVRRKLVVGSTAALVIAAAVIATVIHVRNSPPPFNVQPLRTGTPVLTTQQVQTTLGREFRVVRRVSQVPSAVRQGFSLLAKEPFRMVNPGQEMSTDMILPGVPNKRLVFAGMADNAAVLVYEQGGYVGSVHAAVFSYSNGGGMWGAMLDDYDVRDIATLRSAVQKGRFKTWKQIEEQSSVPETGRKESEDVGRGVPPKTNASDTKLGSASNFFPPGVVDQFLATWYSRQLNALQEPSLWELSQRSPAQSYRFTWLRTFHHPIAVRVDATSDGICLLTTKVTSGAGGYNPGKLIENRTQPLTRQQSEWFLGQISALNFWHLRDGSGVGGNDGAQWIIEGTKNGKYHIVDEWSPKCGAVRKLGLLMAIGLSNLNVPKDEIY